MKRNSYSSLAFAAVVALGLVASSLAIAADGRDCLPPVNTPSANSAVLDLRTFNDCPASTVTALNNYPAIISIRDTDEGCVGWANLHTWSFSEDGITRALFENCSHYKFSTVVNISGFGAVAEGGLRLSPWWNIWWGGAPVDGRFMVRAGGNGEIACFGGRLPFYSFTSGWGVTYTPGTDIWMEIIYTPHALTVADPATILYKIYYQGNTYYSPYLPFDEGNAGENPPHGVWGSLWPTTVGGYFQLPGGNGGALYDMTAKWKDIYYEGPSATSTSQPTWGQLKTLYR
jgi:hypothetical protein